MKKNIKDEIRHCAVELFYQNGYEETTMREIARNCNISVGNLNYHYKKKEDILKEAIISGVESVRKYVANDNGLTKSYLVFQVAFLKYIVSKPGLMNLFVACAQISPMKEFYVDYMYELYCKIRLIQEDCKDSYMVIAGFCTLQFGLVELCITKQYDIDDVNRFLIETILFQLNYEQKHSELITFILEHGEAVYRQRIKDKDLYF